jgi:hypothetical protein
MVSDSSSSSSWLTACLLIGCYYHPDSAVRSRLNKILEAWLEDLSGAIEPDGIKHIITSQQGTAIEPFSLTDADISCATSIIRAAFSRDSTCERVRIVGRETIGSHGGLVITRNLRSYYCERFVKGKSRQEPKKGVSFLPTLIDGYLKRSPAKKKAVIRINNRGACIVVDQSISEERLVSLLRLYQDHSRISNDEKTLAQIGIRIEAVKQQLRLHSGSPESQIRVMGYMADGRGLILDPGSSNAEAPVIVIPLISPDSTQTSVPIITCASDFSCPWIAPHELPPISDIPDDLIVALGHLIPLPKHIASTIWDKLI